MTFARIPAFARFTVLIAVWFSFVASTSRADDKNVLSPSGYVLQSWTVNEGLPHNIVNQVIQDSRGYLWIASGAGLVRFDGRSFKEFSLQKASVEANYNIRAIDVEREGLVVLPASGGVLRLDDKGFVQHPIAAALPGKSFLHLFAEPSGVLWVETGDHHLARWEDGQLNIFERGRDIPSPIGRFKFAVDTKRELWFASGESIGRYHNGKLEWLTESTGVHMFIAAARSGGLWVSSSDHLVRLENGKSVPVQGVGDWSSVARYAVQQLFEDRQGNLWIGTRRKGLFVLTSKGIQAVPAPADNITTIMQDTEDNIWVGTHGGGIGRLRPKAFVALDNGNGSSDSERTSLCDDATGALWFASRSGGLSRYYQKLLDHFTVPTEGRQPEVYLVCPDKEGLVWVATSVGLFTISTARPGQLVSPSFNLKGIRIMLGAKNGDVWFVFGDYGIGYVRKGVFHDCSNLEGRPAKRVRAITEAANGGIWLATSDRDLFEFAQEKFTEHTSGQQIPGGILNALLIDSHGALWMATSSGLVAKQGDHFERYGREEGLSDEIISQILEDDRARLWCATRHGFSVISLEDLRAVSEGKRARVTEVTLGRDDGFPPAFALNSLAPIPWRARDGRLWFATHGGFVGIDPGASLPAWKTPRVYIDELEVDNRLMSSGESVRLEPGEHKLIFRFAAPSFSGTGKVRLRHQLIGFDADWVETGTDHNASYTHLEPGNYRMRLAVTNAEGGWSETETKLALTIPPAWWQSWLFRFTASIALVTGFGWLVRHWSQRRLRIRLEQLEREQQLERERARIARDLHDELGYSVTQIGLIADRLKGDAAEPSFKESLGELASCTRRLSGELEGVVWAVSPKNDKWDRLASYVRQFVLNFFADTPIACTVDGTHDAPGAPLAPGIQHHLLAILKEALNNILKHSRASRVELSLAFEDRIMNLTIRDNGIGFDPLAPEHSERNGLTNLRVRALEIGGKLDILSSPGSGTELKLCLDMGAKLQPRHHATT